MQYLGGKSRTYKIIVPILESLREGREFHEPFVGAAWITQAMVDKRYAYDNHPQLIAMWKALQNGWIPPDKITKEEYLEAKEGLYPDYLTGFIGFGCSFGGKYFGGFARNTQGYEYAKMNKNSIMRKLPRLLDVEFKLQDYTALNVENTLIYADPPYANTTKYSKSFDHTLFWNTIRIWSKRNIVVVSEYTAPDDFKPIHIFNSRMRMRDGSQTNDLRVEKLFVYNGI